MYKTLLEKYIKYIEAQAGSSYLTSINNRAGHFTKDEWVELRRLVKEIHRSNKRGD